MTRPRIDIYAGNICVAYGYIYITLSGHRVVVDITGAWFPLSELETAINCDQRSYIEDGEVWTWNIVYPVAR